MKTTAKNVKFYDFDREKVEFRRYTRGNWFKKFAEMVSQESLNSQFVFE